MTKKKIRCILCPIGCIITCEITEENVTIKDGQGCKQGIKYVQREALCPQRTITTSVRVERGEWPLVSVKTTRPVPKEKIFSVMESIKTLRVTAPIALGDIINRKIGGTQADLVSTKKVSRIETIKDGEDQKKIHQKKISIKKTKKEKSAKICRKKRK